MKQSHALAVNLASQLTTIDFRVQLDRLLVSYLPGTLYTLLEIIHGQRAAGEVFKPGRTRAQILQTLYLVAGPGSPLKH